jgi:signal transduction histidine kinase
MTMTPPGDPRPVRVLLIDDDRDDYLLTRDLFAELSDPEFEFDWVGDYDAGLRAILGGGYDVYLLDYRLGARTGLEMLHEIRAAGSTAPIILLTGQGEWEIDRDAVRAGAADYLEKGRLDATLLERSIRHAYLQKRYEAELERQVQERTRELNQLNQDLQREVAVRKQAEEALRDADRRKDEFLATLAHELRNPLAPIRNALEIMRLASEKPESVNKARGMMERQVAQMVRLIDDLLDVSRITRGKLQLVTERVELSAIIESAVEISRPQIEKAELKLSVTGPGREVWLTADRVRLAQVLSNLLNNAAKYTEPGGQVSLVAEYRDSEAVIRVRDTGIGIPPDLLPRVFELFTQVDRSLNRSQGGLGIGLALVRRLVEMHGGRVAAHSDGPGRGAEFVVRIPVEA